MDEVVIDAILTRAHGTLLSLYNNPPYPIRLDSHSVQSHQNKGHEYGFRQTMQTIRWPILVVPALRRQKGTKTARRNYRAIIR